MNSINLSYTHSHLNRCYVSYLLVTFQLFFRWMNDEAFYFILSSSFEPLCHTTYCHNGDSYWPVLFILTFPANIGDNSKLSRIITLITLLAFVYPCKSFEIFFFYFICSDLSLNCLSNCIVRDISKLPINSYMYHLIIHPILLQWHLLSRKMINARSDLKILK